MAKGLLAGVARGDDPAAKRTTRKKELTVKELLTRTLENHWKPKRRASTAAVFERLINKTLIPEFGATRLSDLTRSQIRTWHAKQVDRPRAANHELAVLRKALSLAVADNLMHDNPAKGIELHPEAARDRVPTDDELRAVWRAIDEAPIRPSARLLFKLLALTGCRREEWISACWSHVDLQVGVYALGEGKAGARRIPLNAPTVALLRAVGRSSKWVLPNDAGDGPLTPDNVRSAWDKVREVSGVTDLRIHDLRHAFATRGAALGANALILRDALGHKTLAMTGRYVSRQNDPVRELSERIGQAILTVAGEVSEPTGEVVDLSTRKASA
jgi:integrase